MKSNGGGGESNPRPSNPRGTLHACPLLISHARREEAAKNRRAPDSVKSRGQTPSRRPIASLFNGIWPPTTRRGQGRRSQLIKLRERAEYPQLTDVPSDLRVNGARHASRESLPPSKPYRPTGGACPPSHVREAGQRRVGPVSASVKPLLYLQLAVASPRELRYNASTQSLRRNTMGQARVLAR